MKATKREVPICLNCKKNSADSPNFEVKCYWKKHENLDVRDTCKYFDRGSTNIIIPVNHCFQLCIAGGWLWFFPAYAVSYMSHESALYIRDEVDRDVDEQGRTIHLYNSDVWYLYDANVDLIINNSLPVTTLKRFLKEHDIITKHVTITDAMANNYAAMRDARRIIEQRTKKKVAKLASASPPI